MSRRDAAKLSADIRPMRHATGETRQACLRENRLREGHVIKMAAGHVGVVGEQNVAGVDVVCRIV